MLLTRITLDDIGAYQGPNEIILETTPEKPITLYGGTNGAGKTTLFESIRLCLYGEDFAGKMTVKQYHQKIHRLFHKHAKRRTSASEASIRLEFQYARNGNIGMFRITRKWQNNRGKIDEFLTMEEKTSSKPYSRVMLEDTQVQAMINQMVPKPVTDLFFFDGEKIQNLARSGDESAYIKSSFDRLLGLDVSEQLQDDIDLYLLRSKNGPSESVKSELEQANLEKARVEEKLASLQEKRVFLRTEIGRLHKDLRTKEEKFFSLGGTHARGRQALVDEKARLERRIAASESLLRRLVEGNLPLAIVPQQLSRVKKELESDTVKIKEGFERDTVSEVFEYMIKELEPALERYEDEARHSLADQMRKIASAKLDSLPRSRKPTFNFSLADMSSMQKTIDAILEDDVRAELDQMEDERCLNRLQDINARLDAAPKQDEVGSLYSAIKETTLEIGEMENELLTLERLESREKSLIVLINGRIRKHLAKTRAESTKIRGMEMIPRIRAALEDYTERLRAKKIVMLESNILEGVKRCFHKELITGVTIDPKTYGVTLHKDGGGELQKEELSKGEMQMYATAIIWGLAKTSGCVFPFIIDTPLARLDEQHRENLIRNFYPEASHQVIILSTDTEIVGKYYELLKPHVSNTGMFRYDSIKNCSSVGKGYFVGKENAVAV